jgi:mxaJ protein
LYGDYTQDSPPARIVEAVAGGEVDVAIVWGPLAGYFASRQARPLLLTPVSPEVDPPQLRFAWDISMGVRRGDESRRAELDDFLTRRRKDIGILLAEYGIPYAGSREARPASDARMASSR